MNESFAAMNHPSFRRTFLKQTAMGIGGLMLSPVFQACESGTETRAFGTVILPSGTAIVPNERGYPMLDVCGRKSSR